MSWPGRCAIVGSYLVWLWLHKGKSLRYGILDAIILTLYGVIPTLQPVNFGRVYAAYSGVFIMLSLLWGWQIDRVTPDTFDRVGVCVALIIVWAARLNTLGEPLSLTSWTLGNQIPTSYEMVESRVIHTCEGQENQLNALGLVTNAVVHWNTLYMQVALEYRQSERVDIH